MFGNGKWSVGTSSMQVAKTGFVVLWILFFAGLQVLSPSVIAREKGKGADASAAKEVKEKKGEDKADIKEAKRSKLGEYREQLGKLSKKIRDIENKAVDGSPKLGEEQSQLQALIMKAVEEEGDGFKEAREKMKELGKKIQDETLSEVERQKAIEKHRQYDMRVRKAYQKVLNTKKVRNARKEYSEHLVEAMREENPQTDELIEQYRELARKFQQAVQRERKILQKRMKERDKARSKMKGKERTKSEEKNPKHKK